MLYKIRCRPAFAALFVTLVPGESITTKTGCIVSMDKGILLKTQFAGGLLPAIIRKVFGPQLFWVDRVSNQTDGALTVVLSHSNMGDIERINLSQNSICLQPDVYLAHTSGVTIKNHWAGFKSWLAGEGLWKLKLQGKGRVFIAAYGSITQKMVYENFIVSQGQLLAYHPTLRLRYRQEAEQLNLMISGTKTNRQRTKGGMIYFQSRNLRGLVDYLRSLV